MPYLIGPIPRFRVSFPEAVQENIAEDEYVGDTLERESPYTATAGASRTVSALCHRARML